MEKNHETSTLAKVFLRWSQMGDSVANAAGGGAVLQELSLVSRGADGSGTGAVRRLLIIVCLFAKHRWGERFEFPPGRCFWWRQCAWCTLSKRAEPDNSQWWQMERRETNEVV